MLKNILHRFDMYTKNKKEHKEKKNTYSSHPAHYHDKTVRIKIKFEVHLKGLKRHDLLDCKG